ncbi:MAG TPA: NAD(P)H-binding protein, partial [Solirubrobacterales bacterium]|nr:NAD(P)H-binding protein [Solirubrobacterales bacterium]
MDVAIAGGHGKIGLLLGAMLAERGDRVRGLIRNPDQAGDLQDAGIEAVVCDLEGDGDVAAAIDGADAVVFAAGAGPGSGEERKRTMDLGGAVKLIDACQMEGIKRYVMVSAMGARDPAASGSDGVFRVYLEAKHDADVALVVIGAWDVLDLRRSDGTTLTFGTPAFDEAYTAQLQQGIDAVAATGAKVAFLEVAC